MMVADRSLGSTLKSINVPASAGRMSLGGSYLATIERLSSGSRPRRRHSKNMKTKVSSGRGTKGYSLSHQRVRRTTVGRATRPGSHPTTTVSPSRAFSDWVVSNVTVEPLIDCS